MSHTISASEACAGAACHKTRTATDEATYDASYNMVRAQSCRASLSVLHDVLCNTTGGATDRATYDVIFEATQ